VKRRRVTSYDVARLAGVSRSTVSFVLNNVDMQISEETKQRVLAASTELGYAPDATAQALVSRRTRIIGLVLIRSPHHIDADIFLTQVLDGLIQATQRHNMRLLLDLVEEASSESTYLDLIQSKRIDGLVISGPRSDNTALRSLVQEGFPLVLMGQLPDPDFHYVDVDNHAAAQTAVEHLVGLGHTRIACITNARHSYTAAIQRLQGYRDVLEAHSIPCHDKLVRYGDFTLESGYGEMCSLLDEPEVPSAVFVASDVVAFGAMSAIRERGLRIPDDIAVVGFDDVPLARYASPPLTTAHLPAPEMGRQAGEMLIQLIQGGRPATRHLLLDTYLVVRESCGAASKVQGQAANGGAGALPAPSSTAHLDSHNTFPV
jgi:DNA-binding LacI/PurR family transcriptional regulator